MPVTIKKKREQSEATKDEAARLPYGKTEGPTAAKGPSARDRFPDQSVAIIAGSTAARVTNKSSHPGVDWNG
jgi:hypothetical protein